MHWPGDSPRVRVLLCAGLFLVPALLLLPGANGFPFPPYPAAYSDMTVAHYPYGHYLQTALLKWHTIPMWNPLLFSGAPFAANPLAGLWYPPGWLAFMLPLPLGFNLAIFLHIVWAGAGMYLLLRSLGLRWQAALLGGLAFQALPKIYAHYGAGHVTLLYALAWTPWLLLAGRCGVQRIGAGRLTLQIGSGLVLGLIFLADPRWAPLAGLLWLTFVLWGVRGKAPPTLRRARRGKLLLGQLLLAALFALPLALPLLEFTRLSTRSSLSAQDNLTYSLPPARLLGIFFPAFGGFHEWELYSGAVILALALIGLAWTPVRKQAAFWWLVLLVSLVFALGSAVPGMTLLTRLPGLNLLRVPSRALFISGFSLVVLAAYSLDSLLSAEFSILPAGSRRRLGLPLVALAAFASLLGVAAWMVTGRRTPGFAWGALLTLAACGWIALWLAGRLPVRSWLIGLAVLCLVDLLGVDQGMFVIRPPGEVLAVGAELARYLDSRPGNSRLYTPSYSLPQSTAAEAEIEQANGVDPLQLQSYVRYMQPASGVPDPGYSVTLPPFANGNPATANQDAQPDARLLGLLNVGYLAAQFQIDAPGWKTPSLVEGTWVYENAQVRPRAWTQPALASPGEDIQPVDGVSWSPNRVVITLAGSEKAGDLLVSSEIAYPGWRVTVDGKPAPLQTEAGVLRAVALTPGIRQVVFSFRPLTVYLGAALGLLGILLSFHIRREEESG